MYLHLHEGGALVASSTLAQQPASMINCQALCIDAADELTHIRGHVDL